jgi:hypothetical protein
MGGGAGDDEVGLPAAGGGDEQPQVEGVLADGVPEGVDVPHSPAW